ncbi:hypothetical protein VTL71DRAFT_16569 [Oculimacula yallundae]|uniref:Heterokaryon incompatibility domain-containing protein n=1 Tax=Oculimacula yallundae TaxID=86028 RepID=A0ABR4CET2_9HELO
MEVRTIYQPLDPARKEIRLLQILPEVSDEIFCTIKRISLKDAANSYEALSYAWGTEIAKKKVHIRLDDLEITVTPQENLYQALLHLRYLYRDRAEPLIIWADAICINQSDLHEKTFQVQQMKEVYENASIVTVWLGVAADRSDQLIESLRPWAKRRSGISIAQHVAMFTEEANISLSDLKAFLMRSWWSRVWVVQEVASATVVQFYCGNRRISEDEMSTMFQILFLTKNACSLKVESSRTAFERGIAAFQDFGPRRSIFLELPSERRRRRNDLKLMDRFLELYMTEPSSEVAMKASDPRDLVFSLLEISYEDEALSLKADYSKSVEEVFIETATYFLSIGDMRVLSFAQGADRMTTLPSWVPDWASPITFILPSVRWQTQAEEIGDRRYDSGSGSESSRFPHHGPTPLTSSGISDNLFRVDETASTLDTRQYKASKGLQSPQHAVKTSTSGTSLLISAIVLDCVSEVLGSGSHHVPGTEALFSFWDKIYMAARCLPNGVNPYQDLEEAVFHLLTLDRERIDRSGNWAFCRSRRKYWSSAQRAYKSWTDRYSRKGPAEFWDTLKNDAELKGFAIDSSIVTAGKYAFVTEKGFVGMGPRHMLAGDIVIIIAGADVPFVLRMDEHGQYRLIGEAYVQGVMDGEAVVLGLPVVDIDLY